jgi:hypothetical protein
MILRAVGLCKAKGITAMLCGRLHANTKSAITAANISSLMDGWRGFRCVSSTTASKDPDRLRTRCPSSEPSRRGEGLLASKGKAVFNSGCVSIWKAQDEEKS